MDKIEKIEAIIVKHLSAVIVAIFIVSAFATAWQLQDRGNDYEDKASQLQRDLEYMVLLHEHALQESWYRREAVRLLEQERAELLEIHEYLRTRVYISEAELDRANSMLDALIIALEILTEAITLGDTAVVADMTDLRIPSGASEAQLNELLQRSRLAGMGWYLLEAEREYGVNAIAMIAIMRQESGLGNAGNLWRQNNFADISNGRGGWARFDTPRCGIFALARLLGENYLTPGQRFYRGSHIEGVQTLYAPRSDPRNATWSRAIRSITADAVRQLNIEHVNP